MGTVFNYSDYVFPLYFTDCFFPAWLGQSLIGGVITIGIPIGVLIIVMSFVLTGVYVHKANKDFDRINQEIIREIKQ